MFRTIEYQPHCELLLFYKLYRVLFILISLRLYDYKWMHVPAYRKLASCCIDAQMAIRPYFVCMWVTPHLALVSMWIWLWNHPLIRDGEAVFFRHKSLQNIYPVCFCKGCKGNLVINKIRFINLCSRLSVVI